MYLSKKTINNKVYHYLEDRVYGQKISIYVGDNPDISSPNFIEKLNQFYQIKYSMILEYEMDLPLHYLNKIQVTRLAKTKTAYDLYMFCTPKEHIDSYYNKWYVDYVYSTNAIEGNTLDEGQTAQILEGTSIADKKLREIFEIANYKSLKSYIDSNKINVCLSSVSKINEIILNNIEDKSKGKIRDVEVYLTNVDFELAPSIIVEEELNNIITSYKKEKNHYFERIGLFHQKFEETHPFIDGNGRTGRELINLMLQDNDMPPIIIPYKRRDEYLKALRHGNQFEYDHMVNFLYSIIDEQSEFFEYSIQKLGINLQELDN